MKGSVVIFISLGTRKPSIGLLEDNILTIAEVATLDPWDSVVDSTREGPYTYELERLVRELVAHHQPGQGQYERTHM